jgi:hypothetical protein
LRRRVRGSSREVHAGSGYRAGNVGREFFMNVTAGSPSRPFGPPGMTRYGVQVGIVGTEIASAKASPST